MHFTILDVPRFGSFSSLVSILTWKLEVLTFQLLCTYLSPNSTKSWDPFWRFCKTPTELSNPFGLNERLPNLVRQQHKGWYWALIVQFITPTTSYNCQKKSSWGIYVTQWVQMSFAISESIAAGVVVEAQRFTTLPSLSIRNFSKFH